MKSLLFVIIAASNLMMEQSSQVQMVDGSVSSQTVQVKRDGQPVQLQLRQMQVMVPMGHAEMQRGDVIMLNESGSGKFWWRYQNSLSEASEGIADRFLESFVLSLTNDRIVGFKFDSPVLWVRDWTEQHSSLDEGQASVLATLAHSQADIASGGLNWFQEVNLTEVLYSELFGADLDESPSPNHKLLGVAKQDTGWQVLLAGPQREVVAVRLDDNYQFVSASAVNSPAASSQMGEE